MRGAPTREGSARARLFMERMITDEFFDPIKG
jgi:hypothetical protein